MSRKGIITMPTRMTPTDFFQEMASQLTDVVKRPFRDEPMTVVELREISDRITALCEKEERNCEL